MQKPKKTNGIKTISLTKSHIFFPNSLIQGQFRGVYPKFLASFVLKLVFFYVKKQFSHAKAQEIDIPNQPIKPPVNPSKHGKFLSHKADI